MRLPPVVVAEVRGEGLAGLGVLQVGLARDDAARGPGRRLAKKSVRRHCAMVMPRAGAELLTEVVQRFAPIFAPRVAPPPPRTKPSVRGRGLEGWEMDAPERMRADALRLRLPCACAAARPFGCVGLLCPVSESPRGLRGTMQVWVDTKPVQFRKTTVCLTEKCYELTFNYSVIKR